MRLLKSILAIALFLYVAGQLGPGANRTAGPAPGAPAAAAYPAPASPTAPAATAAQALPFLQAQGLALDLVGGLTDTDAFGTSTTLRVVHTLRADQPYPFVP